MSKRRRNKGGRPDRAAGVPPSVSEEGQRGGRRRPVRSAPTGRPTPSDALRPRFWETVPLDEMTGPEWEALCDGCGKCCVLKLEDADTGRVHYTDVTCRLFNCGSRRCGQYALRQMFIPGCVTLTPENLADAAEWMPASCAYRRLHEGRGLADWHPLISGDPDSVARAGQALTGPTVPEYEVAEEDLEDHVIDDDILHDKGDTQ